MRKLQLRVGQRRPLRVQWGLSQRACPSTGAFLNGRRASSAGFRTLQVKPQSREARLWLVSSNTSRVCNRRLVSNALPTTADTGYIGRSSAVCCWYKGLMFSETMAHTDGQTLRILINRCFRCKSEPALDYRIPAGCVRNVIIFQVLTHT